MSEQTITDEMVDAYVRAIFSGWYIEMKGEELRQDVRAGLAAVVPLIRAQVAAGPDERTYDLGYLSLPAEIQAEAERAVSDGTAQHLLVPTGPPRDPHAATVPFEAFVGDHPDHIDWVRDTGRCMASGPHECVSAASAEGQEHSEVATDA